MHHRTVRILSAVRIAAFLSIAVTGAEPAAAQLLHAQAASAVQRLEASAGAPVTATYSRRRGTVTFLAATPGKPIPVAAGAGVLPEARARSFLKSTGDLFGLVQETGFSKETVTASDEVAMSHVRLRLTVRGIPVAGAVFGVHLVAGGVTSASAVDVPGLGEVDTIPTVSEDRAQDLVRLVLKSKLDASDITFARSELQILNPSVFGAGDSRSRLTWFLEARGQDLRQFVWIDAQTGETAMRLDALTEARNRLVHDGDHDSVLPGSLVRGEGDPALADDDVDTAYDYSGDTYDYFFSEHGRDSYDNAGATLSSTVRHCPDPFDCPYQNAFWDGTQMVYGDGFSRADDVTAHELTHAVTEHSANLVYCMQSGALNESFSDIFGEAVDLGNGGGSDGAGDRWLLGEDIPIIGAIRNMSDPASFDQPASTLDPEYFCSTSCLDYDNGGVHINSGVMNHVFALVVDGGTYRSHTITGIGVTKAGKIFYRTLNHYLTDSSQFIEAAQSLIQSCNDLVGTSGISAGDCLQLDEAIQATAMDEPACPVCGDGFASGAEECDDGNQIAGDGCDPNCTTSRCGNGVVAPGEQCDDGNASDDDFCASDCTLNPDCQLYPASGLPLAILDNNSTTSTVSVVHPGSVTQVGMFNLSGQHTFVGDLTFALTNPAGVSTILGSGLCSDADNFSLSFLDAGSTTLQCPLTDNGIHPAVNPLWPLGIDDPDGTWTLTVADTALEDQGSLQGWSLLLCNIARPSLTGCGSIDAPALAPGAIAEYALDLAAPEVIRLETTGPGGCPGDSLISIYTAAGDLVAEDDNDGEGSCSRLVQPLAAGSYVVRIEGAGGQALEPYTVTFSGDSCAICGNTETEGGEECDDGNLADGDGCDHACEIERLALDVCTDVDAAGFPEGGSNQFEFTLTGDGPVRLETSGAGGCPGDTVIYLYDSLGEFLAYDDDGGDGVCSRLETSLTTGSYVAVVEGYAGRSLPPYRMRLDTPACGVCGNDVLEFGEECDDGNLLGGDGCDGDCAREIPSIDVCASNLESGFASGEFDEFRFTLTGDGPVTLETSGPSGCPADTILELYTSNGIYLGGDDDGGLGVCSQLQLTLSAGSYLVIVRGYSGQAVPEYTLAVTATDCPCSDDALQVRTFTSDASRFLYKGSLLDPAGYFAGIDPRTEFSLEVTEGLDTVTVSIPASDPGWAKSDPDRGRYKWKGDPAIHGLAAVKFQRKAGFWALLLKGKSVPGAGSIDASATLDFLFLAGGTCHETTR